METWLFLLCWKWGNNDFVIETITDTYRNTLENRFFPTSLFMRVETKPTRNILTQASKNGRKHYLFPQKKFVKACFMQYTYLTPSIISNRQTFIVRRENAFCKFYTFFGFVYHVSCLPWFETKTIIKWDVLMSWSTHLHTEIYPNLKSISEFFKMYMKNLDSFI